VTFSWGFSGVATSLMVLVSGLANLVMRLLLVLVGLVAPAIDESTNLSAAGGRITGGTVLATAAVTVVVIGMLFSSRFRRGRRVALGDGAAGLLRLFPAPSAEPVISRSAVDMQRRAMPLLREGLACGRAFGMVPTTPRTIFFGIALRAGCGDLVVGDRRRVCAVAGVDVRHSSPRRELGSLKWGQPRRWCCPGPRQQLPRPVF
jgi:hypothetical protein